MHTVKITNIMTALDKAEHDSLSNFPDSPFHPSWLTSPLGQGLALA